VALISRGKPVGILEKRESVGGGGGRQAVRKGMREVHSVVEKILGGTKLILNDEEDANPSRKKSKVGSRGEKQKE